MSGYPVDLQTLIAGENLAVGAQDSLPRAREYQEGVGATSAADVNLGPSGAAGDYLDEVRIRLAATGQPCTTTIKDGTVVLEAFTVTAQADNTTVIVPVGRESKNGGWRLNFTCTGTMANIRYNARGLFR